MKLQGTGAFIWVTVLVGCAGSDAGTSGAGGAAGSSGTTSSGGSAGNHTSGGGGAPSGGAGGRTLGTGGGLASGSGGRTGTLEGGLGGAGGTTMATLNDYISRKWARWPIPNPPSLGYPHPMTYASVPSGGIDAVTDTVTGLVWQATTNAATTTWQDALNACETLGPGWSLPTRIELTSILDNTQQGAKANGTYFQFGNKAGWTWASTPWIVDARKSLTGDAALSWFINFSQGDSNNSLSQTAASAYARCVKIPATQTLSAEHYATANGEVTDNYTGLVWQQGDSGPTPLQSWDQASAFCTNLGLNGQPFRLPSLNELASIVDDVPAGNVSPAVDHATFPATSPNQKYWSASSYGTSATDKWSLNFEDGFTQHQATSTLAMAKCVR